MTLTIYMIISLTLGTSADVFAPVLITNGTSCVTFTIYMIISLTLGRNCKWTGKKHWFVKQDQFRMPLHDCALLYTLQLEQPAGGCY